MSLYNKSSEDERTTGIQPKHIASYIDKSNYNAIKQLLIKNDIIIEYGYGIRNITNILKTKENNHYCSVDFYMATIDEKGNFNDKWENVIWSECYNENNELIEYM